MAKRDSMLNLQRQLYLATQALDTPGASSLEWAAGHAARFARESCDEALSYERGEEVSAGWALPAADRALAAIKKLIEAERHKVQELERLREQVGIAVSVVDNEEIKEVL